MSLHQSIKARLRTVERNMEHGDERNPDDDLVSPEVADAMIKAGNAWAKANGITARALEEWPDDEPIPDGMAAAMIEAGLRASGEDNTGPEA